MGRLRQGLNWLLNALAPPPPPPRPKPRPKPKLPAFEEVEILNNEPTNITPVFDNTLKNSPTPDRQVAINSINSLSDSEFRKLLSQLDAAQRDPSKLKNVDLSFLRNTNSKNVEVSHLGTSGASTKIATVRARNIKSTTAIPISTNSLNYEEEVTTSKPRITLPPVQLDPIPGIPDENIQVRGQLISAAVNVTKAISSFLGSAIQVRHSVFFF